MGGVGCQNWKYSKCQEMAKFQFFWGDGGVGCQNWKYSNCQEMPKFQFGGGWGVRYSQPSQNSKCQDLPKFQFQWGGGGEGTLLFWEYQYSQNFEPNFQPLQQAHASQIVSHILRMWRLMTGGWHTNSHKSTYFPYSLYLTDLLSASYTFCFTTSFLTFLFFRLTALPIIRQWSVTHLTGSKTTGVLLEVTAYQK